MPEIQLTGHELEVMHQHLVEFRNARASGDDFRALQWASHVAYNNTQLLAELARLRAELQKAKA